MAYDPGARLLIYAQEALGRGRSKTAEGVIRYGQNPIAAIVDASLAGSTAQQVLGYGGAVPIVASIAESLPFAPDRLLLGLAPPGGHLPPEWHADVKWALEHGLDVISGLHDILGADPVLCGTARSHGRSIWDVRLPREHYPIANARAAGVAAQTVLAVGTDCSLGKMTTMLEMLPGCRATGRRTAFLATGQTGIMISGFGVPVDRVIGDFMAGAVEELVLEHAAGNDLLLVEGQGSLLHPGYSGVTLSLLHGAAPSHLILCHEASRTHVRDCTVVIPPLDEMCALYERAAAPIRRALVIGIALKTTGLDDTEARRAIEAAESLTGLPATDPVRFGAEKLVAAVNRAK